MYVHAGSNSFFIKLCYLQASEQGRDGSGFGTFEGLCFTHPSLASEVERQAGADPGAPPGPAGQGGEGGAPGWDANPKQ